MNNPHLIPIQFDNVNPQNTTSPASIEQEKPDSISNVELYNAIFENAFHPMYVASEEENLLKFNEKLCLLFEFSKHELLQKKSLALFNINENNFIDFLGQRNLNGIAKAEITGIKKSGQTFPCRISSVIYESEEGKRSMNTIVDISKEFTLAKF
ncbi:MAG: PAS domain-containing protein [Ginsengibacter sp.]